MGVILAGASASVPDHRPARVRNYTLGGIGLLMVLRKDSTIPRHLGSVRSRSLYSSIISCLNFFSSSGVIGLFALIFSPSFAWRVSFDAELCGKKVEVVSSEAVLAPFRIHYSFSHPRLRCWTLRKLSLESRLLT